jgi:hypothetical protein
MHQELAGKVVAQHLVRRHADLSVARPARLQRDTARTSASARVAGRGVVAPGVATDASLMAAKCSRDGGTPVLG